MAAAGLYLHVPFCAHRCGYCDFNVATGHDADLRAAYVAALDRRLAQVAEGGWPPFGSVFVGGGTPTQLSGSQVGEVVRATRAHLDVAADAEVTVEANPEDVDAALAAALAHAGATRVSLGAQSFDLGVLGFLDRRHDPGSVPRAVDVLRAAGVAQINLDLIYGASGEDGGSWDRTLDAAVGLDPDHLSCYALTLSPGTPYWREVTLGRRPAPDDDVAADRMAQAGERLAAAGYERYEASNWARPGARCRHNAATWAGGDYLGVGAGAHSHRDGRRWWEVRPTRAWIAAVHAGDPVGGREVLDPAARRIEALMTGLRTVAGVPRARVAPIDEAAARRLVAGGVLRDDGGWLRVPPDRLGVADGVARRLLG